MTFESAGNRPKFNRVNRSCETLPSALRLGVIGIALAACFATAGCGQTGAQPSTSKGITSATSSGGSQLSPSASTVAFGNVAVGSSTSELVTLTAAGGQSITISSVTASGTGFVVSPKSNVVLTPNQSLTISVSFEPTSAGTATGRLLIASSASNANLQISLSGDGVTSSHSVTLSWQPSRSAVAGYFVFRGSSASTLAQLNAQVLPSTSYTDRTIANGQTYVYAVKSVNSSNAISGYSNFVTVSVPAN